MVILDDNFKMLDKEFVFYLFERFEVWKFFILYIIFIILQFVIGFDGKVDGLMLVID